MDMSESRKNVLKFIKAFIKENGYSPTVREIGAGVDLYSSSTVHRHLECLKRDEYITYVEGSPRTIRVLKK